MLYNMFSMRSGKITPVILNRGCSHADGLQQTYITIVNVNATIVNVNSQL